MAVVLAMGRRLPEFIVAQRRGEWNRDSADSIDDIEGKTVLVVGYGSIGRALALRLAPFGVRVVGIAQPPREDVESPDSLPLLLPEPDIVVDLLPPSPHTHTFLHQKFL